MVSFPLLIDRDVGAAGVIVTSAGRRYAVEFPASLFARSRDDTQ